MKRSSEGRLREIPSRDSISGNSGIVSYIGSLCKLHPQAFVVSVVSLLNIDRGVHGPTSILINALSMSRSLMSTVTSSFFPS
jgi:hypothetical protein